ncbi:MAG TPA: hypothetical protein VHU19_06555 [Pyrinomonadaceae bacterium]|jgi:hypothetical protein|nr:hypothetical protein [Pyrinomonadaceae bacterium]
MKGQAVLFVIPPFVLGPVGYVVVILFGVELLAPRAWIVVEDVWWRAALGKSSVARVLKDDAQKDFKESIDQWVVDRSLPHPLAVLLTILFRPFELKRLTGELRGRKREMIEEIFDSAVRQLNAGWLDGKAPDILCGYIRTILDAADEPVIDEVTRLRGLSAVAIVKYALGDLIAGNELGAENFKEAHRLESGDKSELKWIASYGYFYSTLFLGDFKKAMRLMAGQWSRYFASLDDGEKEALKKRLSGCLILNPILAVPRHIILAAAFNEQPCFEPEFWPSCEVYDKLTPDERTCRLRWAEEWYAEAKRVCEGEPTSLSFSHAYFGFYLTLLLLEEGMSAGYLHEKIKEAFDAIDDTAIVSQYVRHGFTGVYHLVCGEDEKALECLSQAATYSAISGNKFASLVFNCSHAVAAARLNRPSRYLEPDIAHYLSEAERLARTVKRPFYQKLFYGAKSAVCHLRGETARARRFATRSKHGEAGNRILKIFCKDGQCRRDDK